MSRALQLARPLATATTIGQAALIILPSIALLCTPYPYLAVAPGLAAIAVCVGATRPQLVFAAILITIPFGAFRGPLQKILAFGLILLIVGQCLKYRPFPAAWKSRLWPWLAAFFAVNLLSAWLSEYRAASIEDLKLLLTAMVFFALGLYYLNEPGIHRALPALVGWSVSAGSLLAVVGFVFNLRPFLDPAEQFKRATGGTVTAPTLAALIVFGTPFMAYCMGQARRPSGKALWGGLILLNLAAVVTTYSRGGALVFSMLLMVITLRGLRRLPPRTIGLVAAGGLVLLAVALPLVPPSYWERQSTLTDLEDRSIGRRTAYLRVAAEAVQAHPILGSGPGSFRKLFGESTWSLHFKGANQKTLERYAHNTYIEVLVGSGLIGLALFLIILANAVWSFTRAHRHAVQRGDFARAEYAFAGRLALVVLLVYLLIYSSVYDKFLWVGLALSQAVMLDAQDRGLPT